MTRLRALEGLEEVARASLPWLDEDEQGEALAEMRSRAGLSKRSESTGGVIRDEAGVAMTDQDNIRALVGAPPRGETKKKEPAKKPAGRKRSG